MMAECDLLLCHHGCMHCHGFTSMNDEYTHVVNDRALLVMETVGPFS
jgi:hypothetical protein